MVKLGVSLLQYVTLVALVVNGFYIFKYWLILLNSLDYKFSKSQYKNRIAIPCTIPLKQIVVRFAVMIVIFYLVIKLG